MKTSQPQSTRFHNLDAIKEWTTQDADEIYQISRWGEGYFGVTEKGDLCVRPNQKVNGPTINIMEVVEEMKAKNIPFPAVIRFHDILRSQVINLNKTFQSTIEEAKFGGKYFGVYPIKVNQMREVVDEVVDAGSAYNYGLEAGSKPELMAALAMNTNQNSLTIINGYKDRDFLRLAILGIQLGRKVIVVVEKYSELEELLKLSAETGIEPMIGLRAKIATKSSGKWAHQVETTQNLVLQSQKFFRPFAILKRLVKNHALNFFTSILDLRFLISEQSKIQSLKVLAFTLNFIKKALALSTSM